MRGGYLRYQAQYLRRIRLPRWSEVPKDLQDKLKEAARRGDAEEYNRVTFALYGLTADERAALGDSDGSHVSSRSGIEYVPGVNPQGLPPANFCLAFQAEAVCPERAMEISRGWP